MCVEQAGVDPKTLKPLDIVMPVNPTHTWQEWQEIFAAQLPRPGNNTTVSLGTEPQSGKDLHHTFRCSS